MQIKLIKAGSQIQDCVLVRMEMQNGTSIKWYVQSLMHSETDDAPTNSRNTETDDAPTNRRHGFHSCLIYIKNLQTD